MLIHGKKLIGKNVLSIQEGKIVADIENILLSQKKNKLTGFAVRKKGVLGETGVLAFEDIESFGDDAVVIKKESLIKQTEEAPAALSKTMKNGVNLTALDVVSDSGEDVGEFIDISVDSNTGEIKK